MFDPTELSKLGHLRRIELAVRSRHAWASVVAVMTVVAERRRTIVAPAIARPVLWSTTVPAIVPAATPGAV